MRQYIYIYHHVASSSLKGMRDFKFDYHEKLFRLIVCIASQIVELKVHIFGNNFQHSTTNPLYKIEGLCLMFRCVHIFF